MLDIRNYYEQLVTERLFRMAKYVDELTHKDFMEDVTCVALNHLPSRYVRSLVDLHSHCSDVDSEAITQQVSEAIDQALIVVRRRSNQLRE